MVIAAGSYPAGRWFESDRRYQIFGMSQTKEIAAYAEEWPLGQVVKTSPFHGGIMGSNPVGVTKQVKANPFPLGDGFAIIIYFKKTC